MSNKIETIFLLFLIFCISFIVSMTSITMYQNNQDTVTFIMNMIILYSVFVCLLAIASVKLSILAYDCDINKQHQKVKDETNTKKSDWDISHTLMVIFFIIMLVSGIISEFDTTDNALIICMTSGVITGLIMTYQMYRL